MSRARNGFRPCVQPLSSPPTNGAHTAKNRRRWREGAGGHLPVSPGLVCCGALHPSPTPAPTWLTRPWLSRLRAWPGVLTLLSVLAVVLGTPVRPPEVGQRLNASNVAPALPEVRAAPQPGLGVPVLTPPPPAERFWLVREQTGAQVVSWSWQQPPPLSDLDVLGRRQTDGG